MRDERQALTSRDFFTITHHCWPDSPTTRSFDTDDQAQPPTTWILVNEAPD